MDKEKELGETIIEKEDKTRRINELMANSRKTYTPGSGVLSGKAFVSSNGNCFVLENRKVLYGTTC